MMEQKKAPGQEGGERENNNKCKDTAKWRKEYLLFWEYLKENDATCTMAAVALNIYRPNACRYKRWLQDAGKLWELKKGICAITRFPAKYLTTNPSKAPVNSQASLFEGMEGGNDGK